MLKSRYLSGALLVALVLPAGAVSARENMGDVLRSMESKEKIPAERQKDKQIVEPENKSAAKTASGGKTVKVNTINLEGNTLLKQAQLDAVIKPYEGKEMTMEGLNEVTEKVTSTFRAAGYLLAYAYLPPQTIKEGVVNMRVVVGKIGEVEVTGNQHYDTAFIEKHLAVAKARETVTDKSLERALLLLNDYSDLKVKAALKPGKEAGTTDVVASVTDKRPLHFGAFYDNYGSKYTSKDRLGIRFGIGNLMKSGDYLGLTGITAINPIAPGDLSYGRVDYQIPFGHQGSKLNFYFADSVYEVGEAFADAGANGKALMAGFSYTFPCIKTRLATLEAKVGFDYKDVNDYYKTGSADSEDEQNIRIATLGATYDFRDRYQGRNVIGATFHLGLRDLLNGSDGTEYGTLPYDTDFDFQKYTLNLARLQRLSTYNNLIVSFAGQYSADDLPTPEQLSIGGPFSVRGHQLSEELGDRGYIASLEFQLSPLFTEETLYGRKLGDTYKIALFADYGTATKTTPIPKADEVEHLSGLGAGLRLYLGENVSAKYDYAVPEKNGNYNTANAEHMFNVNVNF